MLSSLVLRLSSKHGYFLENFNSFDALYTLYSFLTSDGYSGWDIKQYLDLLKKNTDGERNANQTFLEIIGEKINLNDSYDTALPVFSTSRSNMIKILDDWHSILQQQPPFIKITMDEHQNVTFIALNEYHSQKHSIHN